MEGEREGEKHQCVVASHMPTTGDLACNPGMCPDWESNQRPFDRRPALNPLSHTSQGFKFKLRTILGFLEKTGLRLLLSDVICRRPIFPNPAGRQFPLCWDVIPAGLGRQRYTCQVEEFFYRFRVLQCSLGSVLCF